MSSELIQMLITELRNSSPQERKALASLLSGCPSAQNESPTSREETRECPILKKLTGDGEIRVLLWANQHGTKAIVCPYFQSTFFCTASPLNKPGYYPEARCPYFSV